MSLVEYRRKRRFDQTKEPEPGKALPQGQRAIFVVQLHHASRRHYDFRLQIGDALKSWAVPKGPSYDPKVKRMAVEVEDHPVDYASFEGEIPKGQYGGGHVAQFDHGVWATQGDPEAQLAKGHLRFELFGTKLKGGWHLVRSGKPARQPQWLLFKDDDAYASDLEADDLLADVSAAPTADIKRAGGGKADKKKLKALPAKRARRKNWAKKALALPKAKEAAPPSRVLVQRTVADRLRAALVEAYGNVRLGESEDPQAQLGPLIDKASVARVDAVVAEAASYANVLVRGGPIEEGPLAAGAFYRPSLIEVEDLNAYVVQNEVFGPVQTFEIFEDEADAIARANATEFGLAASVFSEDASRCRRVGKAIRAGHIWMNCWGVMSEQFEQSGFKQSGIGVLCGPRAIEQFQEIKVYATAALPSGS